METAGSRLHPFIDAEDAFARSTLDTRRSSSGSPSAHTDDLAFQLWQLGHRDFAPRAAAAGR